MEAARLAHLPRREVLGAPVLVASSFRSRLLGLAFLRREHAGPGLLIPRCRSVHTFGMRFPLDVVFLDGEGRAIAWVESVPAGRLVGDRRASAVLEIPAEETELPLPRAE